MSDHPSWALTDGEITDCGSSDENFLSSLLGKGDGGGGRGGGGGGNSTPPNTPCLCVHAQHLCRAAPRRALRVRVAHVGAHLPAYAGARARAVRVVRACVCVRAHMSEAARP